MKSKVKSKLSCQILHQFNLLRTAIRLPIGSLLKSLRMADIRCMGTEGDIDRSQGWQCEVMQKQKQTIVGSQNENRATHSESRGRLNKFRRQTRLNLAGKI
jgi:hypothetical protein